VGAGRKGRINGFPRILNMNELVIEAGRRERHYWRDVWRYRELFYFLAWRDLLVRYKQTVVGVAWSLIRPFLTMIVLTVVFGKFGKMPSGGVPYPILVLCGLLPWQFFSTALSESGNSLVSNANLITKIYFPRLVIPASSVIISFVDFLISATFLVLLMIWYHFVPSTEIVFLPLFVVLAFAASLGIGMWIAALMVEYRDFRFIVPFIVQFGLYISPVGFYSNVVPEKWRLLYSLNPMVGVIDGFRWAILGGEQAIYLPGMIVSVLGVAVLLLTGLRHFRNTERTFADVI
jgi:lipopolysaccharide transport system permease protein